MPVSEVNLKFISMALVVGMLVFTSGCVEEMQQEDETAISVTSFCIGDVPTDDFIHVNITFSEVKLHSNETGWINIPLNVTTVDLLYLHMNNLTETLGIGEINVGNYTKLWIVIDTATGVLQDTNETVYFEVPSGTLKIQQLFKLEEGNNTFTVDIDLENSILVYGGGEKYTLLPVISELNVSYANGTKVRFRNHERITNYGNGTQVKLKDNNTLKNMIGNRKPTIDIVVNDTRGNHVSAMVNETIGFDASGTIDIDGDDVTFVWDFDDGSTATNSTVNHSYTESGTYHVTLTVSDGELTDSDIIIVTITNQTGNGNSGQGNGPPN